MAVSSNLFLSTWLILVINLSIILCHDNYYDPSNYPLSTNVYPVTVKSQGSRLADQALVNISNLSFDTIRVWYLNERCYRCNVTLLCEIEPNTTVPYYFNTWFSYQIFVHTVVTPAENRLYCSPLNRKFDNGNQYILRFYVGGRDAECNLTRLVGTSHENMGVLYGFLYIIALLVLYYCWAIFKAKRLMWKVLCCMQVENNVINDLGSPHDTVETIHVERLTSTSTEAKKEPEGQLDAKRVKSLDFYRGASMLMLVFINYGGGGYWYFRPSVWNGLTVGDVVFPWFVFIMGVAIGIVLQPVSRNEIRLKTKRFALRIVRRGFILFTLGIVISNPAADAPKIRICGVLQRLAVSYTVVALVELIAARQIDDSPIVHGWKVHVKDLVPYWPQWLFTVSLAILWIIITFAVEVPGCPRGYVGPGGIQLYQWTDITTAAEAKNLFQYFASVNYTEAYNLTECTGGMAGYIDRSILGQHTYQFPTAQEVYGQTPPYDPEGILGNLTSIVLTFLGLHCGRILIVFDDIRSKMSRWIIWGFALGLLGASLCGFSAENGPIPINKNLWSLSYILVAAGTSYIMFAVAYFLLDEANVWNGDPFIYAGMNAILLYGGSELLNGYFPFSFGFVRPSHTQFMIQNITATAIWVVAAIVAYNNKFFLKI